MAFDLAARHYQIDPLLDPEDVNTNKPDKKSILMYVMCLYHAIDMLQTQMMSAAGSIQTLDQHFDAGSSEEIQLLQEKDPTRSARHYDNDRQREEQMSSGRQLDEPFHPGNSTDLDEISLAKSIDDLSRLPGSSIKRSSTFTINKKEMVAEATPADVTGAHASREGASSHFHNFMESQSRPLSTATNASIEIGGYQNAIEIVLSLLLEAEEILSKQLPDIKELSEAKAQFQTHEEFMVQLSEYQEYVGGALEEGARLLSEPMTATGLTAEDQSEIKQQMLLLNERWETLRMSALDVQSRVHARLADIQLRKIEELRVLLTNTEDKISRIAEIDPSPDVMKKQMEEHRALEASLNDQKLLVDDLSNLVVIVNDDSFNEMEDKLSALGERWSHVVSWTKNRFERLQQVRDRWKRLSRQFGIVHSWLQTRESDLKQMETKTVTEIGSVMERMRNLRFCAADLHVLYENMLQLHDAAEQLKPSTDRILEKLENLEDRCDALKEIVDVQQQRIEGMGFNFGAVVATTSVELPFGWTDFQVNFESAASASDDEDEAVVGRASASDASPQQNKKRKLQKSEKQLQLDRRIDEMEYFVATGEQTLAELHGLATLRDQRNALEHLQSELKQKIDQYADVKALLTECATANGDDLAIEQQKIGAVASKYDELNFRLEHLIDTNAKGEEREKFHRNLTGFKLVLADCRDWFNVTLNASTQDDLQNRLSYMESLDSEIAEAQRFCNEATNAGDLTEWQNDFQQFHQSWCDIKSAIQRLLHEKFGIEETISEEDGVNVELDTLRDVLTEAEQSTMTVSTLDKMTDNLARLNDVKKRLEEFRGLVTSNSEDFERWEKTAIALDERIIKQTTAMENLNHFNSEYEVVVHFLSEMERRLQRDVFILGETDDLERQKGTYEANGVEIKKIEIDIISVRNFSEIIVRETDNDDSEHKQTLTRQIQALNDLYARLIRLYEENSKSLQQTIKRTQGILKQITETEEWLTELETLTPTKAISDIKTSNELFQIRTKFQTLKETCEQKTIAFRELNELGSEQLLQIDEQLNQPHCDRKYSSLAKQFTKLNARWNEVTTLVYNRTGLLEHLSNQLGELKTMLVSETGYLDKLEKCLRKSPENAADAEEIYEELDVRLEPDLSSG